jgi:hypothetical protein
MKQSRTYEIGIYEIHPTTIEELESAIKTNFSIADQLSESDTDGIYDILLEKIIGLVRYYNDHSI